MPVVAGADPERAGQIGLAASGRGDDQQVHGVGPPVVGGVASHPDRGDPAPVTVVDLRDRRARDREPASANQFVDLVDPALFERVVDGGQEQLLRGEGVVGLVADEFFEPSRYVRDPQGPELVVVDAGERHRDSSPPGS